MTNEADVVLTVEETLRRALNEAAANAYGWHYGRDAISGLVHRRHVPREEVCAVLHAFEADAAQSGEDERARYVAALARAWSPPPGKEHVMQSSLTDRELMLEAIETADNEDPLYYVVYWLVHGRKSDRKIVERELYDIRDRLFADNDREWNWITDAIADLTGWTSPSAAV